MWGGPEALGPQPGRALGLPVCCRGCPGTQRSSRGPLPPAPALGLSTPTRSSSWAAPSFYKARVAGSSEEEVAAASDKRCFLFPAWSQYLTREEKIVPLALRVQGESRSWDPQKLLTSSTEGVAVFRNLTVWFCPCPGCPRKPLTPDLTATMCRIRAPPKSFCPGSSSAFTPPAHWASSQPFLLDQGPPVAAFPLHFRLGCPSRV